MTDGMLVLIGEQTPMALAKVGNSRAFVSGYSAERLVRLCGLASIDQLHERSWLLNLMPAQRSRRGPKRRVAARWWGQMAEHRAALVAPQLMNRRVVLLGVRVARAFGLMRIPLLEWQSVVAFGSRFEAARCPHPSGLNRWWNDEHNREQARGFLTSAIWSAP